MSGRKNASLKDFQPQIQRKYRHLHSLKKLDKETQQKELREKRYGCLFVPLYLLAEFLVKIAKKKEDLFKNRKGSRRFIVTKRDQIWNLPRVRTFR